MSFETLSPGATTLPQRLLRQEAVLFTHKGQGRVTVDGRATILLPGVVVSVPGSAWHAVRNTGTGILQIIWVVSPGGIEEYYRELAKLGAQPELARVQEVAQRFGIEVDVRAPSHAMAPEGAGRRRGRRRGGRGGRHGGRGARAAGESATTQPPASPAQIAAAVPPQVPKPTEILTAAPSAQAALPTHATPAFGAPGPAHRRRRSRGGRGRRRRGAPGATQPPAPGAPASRGAPVSTAPSSTQKSPSSEPPASQRKRRERPRSYRSRVKEVYMGGQWVKVSGEGPVISLGHDRIAGEDPPRKPKR